MDGNRPTVAHMNVASDGTAKHHRSVFRRGPEVLQRKTRVLAEEMIRHAESLEEVRTAPADCSGKRFQALALEQSEHTASRTARAFVASFPLRD